MSKLNKNPIGSRLKSERTRLRKTQEAMADSLFVETQTYQRYEWGKTSIPIEILQKLHTDFKMDLNYLLCGESDGDAESEQSKRLVKDLIETVNQLFNTSYHEG